MTDQAFPQTVRCFANEKNKIGLVEIQTSLDHPLAHQLYSALPGEIATYEFCGYRFSGILDNVDIDIDAILSPDDNSQEVTFTFEVNSKDLRIIALRLKLMKRWGY